MVSPKEEYIKLLTEVSKGEGLDELTSRLMAILYLETKEISLEELAKRTGYSLSGVSTAMKFLQRLELAKKVKKPGSKKAYFYVQKDFMENFQEFFAKKASRSILSLKQNLPNIIENYEKSNASSEELKIIKNQYKQILVFERVMKKILKILAEEMKK